MLPRFLAAVFPNMGFELSRISPEIPAALFFSSEKRKLLREIHGGDRIDQVSEGAKVMGVSPGQTLAQARAAASSLSIALIHPSEMVATFQHIAEALFRISPTVSFDVQKQCVWADVTHAVSYFQTETQLLGVAKETLDGLGFSYRMSVANGPRAAELLASSGLRDLAKVSLASLFSHKPKLVSHFRILGLHTVGDLRSLPRKDLGSILGKGSEGEVALVWGEEPTVLTPYVPAAEVEETWRGEALFGTEPLLFVLRALSERLARKLSLRELEATSLKATLYAQGGNTLLQEEMRVSHLFQKEDLFAVLRARLDVWQQKLQRTVDCETPIEAVCLRAPETSARAPKTRSLFDSEGVASERLPELVSILMNELGVGEVGIFSLASSWEPRNRTLLLPLGERASFNHVGTGREPLRILPTPRRVDPPTTLLSHILRREDILWWAHHPTRDQYPTRRIDTWMGYSNDGALGWFEEAALSWSLQGFFE